MKIIIDLDGTLTNFNQYIFDKAIPYFVSKYGMEIKYPDKLEVEDILDMKNFFFKQYDCSEEEAQKMVKRALDKFWISPRFIEFSLLCKFRPGSKKFLTRKLKEGNDTQIHSSRSKTAEKTIIGKIARTFTILEFYLNGIIISPKRFHFYKNDEEKMRGILESNPDLIFDDKSSLIDKFSSVGKKTICVAGTHNKDIIKTPNVEVIKDFNDDIDKKMGNLFGIKNLKIYDSVMRSELFYKKLRIFRPLISWVFQPIILNSHNNVSVDGGVVYAPNHRSTLDPMIITSVVDVNIHWAALLRFFNGADSIFNNSKNILLCRITSKTFAKLNYFPIERKCDNPNANNFNSIRDMCNYLKLKQNIGIFPEGTTRRPVGMDFGTFEKTFIEMAKKNDSWVQPITTLWIKNSGFRRKLIINFAKPFKVGNMSIEEAMVLFLSIQKKGLIENKEYANFILGDHEKENIPEKTLKIEKNCV